MSLIDKFKAAIDRTWAALGDLIQPVTYHAVTPGAYDPATGAVAETVRTIPNVPAALVDFKLSMVNGRDIQVGDRQALFRAGDLPNLRPKTADRVTDRDGMVWTVAGVRGDPRLYWELVLRK